MSQNITFLLLCFFYINSLNSMYIARTWRNAFSIADRYYRLRAMERLEALRQQKKSERDTSEHELFDIEAERRKFLETDFKAKNKEN